jgi:hypothetical protein
VAELGVGHLERSCADKQLTIPSPEPLRRERERLGVLGDALEEAPPQIWIVDLRCVPEELVARVVRHARGAGELARLVGRAARHAGELRLDELHDARDELGQGGAAALFMLPSAASASCGRR